MAGLANIFPGNYYNSDEAKALDFMGYFAHQRQQDEALKNNSINRDIALEDLFHTQQMNPLRREQQVLANQTSEAQLPGIGASSKQKVMSTEDYEKTRDTQVKAALAKLAKEISVDELKQEQAQIEKMRLNPHISAKDRAVLDFLRNQFTDLYTLQEKNTSAEDRARIAANASGRRTTGTASKPPVDRFAAITKITNPFDKYTAYVAYANELDENDPNRTRALNAAESIRSQAQTAADTRISAGKWEKGPDGKWRQSTAPAIEAPANTPAPKSTAPAATKPMYAKNPQTGERIMSTDGGKTWNPAK